MRTFRIEVDVTMSGAMYVEAENEGEARILAERTAFVGSDLRMFNHVKTEVYESYEVKKGEM